VPEAALNLCVELIMTHRMHLHIEVERKGRYGDYTPYSGKGSRISINHNLSPFEFLITFIHELAHHTSFLKYGANHEPHGAEWKAEYKRCMQPFFDLDIFPYDLKSALAKHMQNPKYTQAADLQLLQVLKKYDERKAHILTLSQLSDGTLFSMKSNPMLLRRIKLLRTYVLCENPQTNIRYKVHAMVEVNRVEQI
jgi:SprT protein